MTKNQEENELLEAIKKKAYWAFDFIFKEYYTRFCFFANKYLNNTTDAEDAVQDVLITFWQKIETLDLENMQKVKSYIYVCLKNRCLRILDLRQRIDIEKNEEVLEILPDSSDRTGFERLVSAEVIGQLLENVNSVLPTGCKNILKMLFLEERTIGEIARSLGISKNTVKSQKARGLKLLREKYGGSSPLLICLLCFFMNVTQYG